jgi:hypothetical protein
MVRPCLVCRCYLDRVFDESELRGLDPVCASRFREEVEVKTTQFPFR